MTETKFKTKDVPSRLIKSPTDGSGIFRALVSTFGGEPDFQNDVIAFGAYSASIQLAKQRRAERGGDGLWPLLWNHGRAPQDVIGWVTDAVETPEGLVIDGVLHLQTKESTAVYEMMLGSAVSSFSIGYAAVQQHPDPRGFNVLDAVALTEISAVLNPANPHTRLLDIKASDIARHDSMVVRAMIRELADTSTIGKDSDRTPSDGELPGLSRLANHLHAMHAYPRSGIVGRTASELEQLHRDLHEVTESHALSDLGPVVRRSATPKSAELSPEAAAFVNAARAQRLREEAEAREMHEQWILNSQRAQAMRSVSFEDEVRQEQREREAWIADRGIVEGEVHRIIVDPVVPEGAVRVSEDDLHNGNTAAGDVR